jgi:hypothetical protein
VAFNQGLNAKGEREAGRADTKGWPHSDRVTAEQVLLKGQHLCRFDALIGEFAEAGVHPIHRLPGGDQGFEALPGALDAPAGRWRTHQLLNPPVEERRRVLERQALTCQREGS